MTLPWCFSMLCERNAQINHSRSAFESHFKKVLLGMLKPLLNLIDVLFLLTWDCESAGACVENIFLRHRPWCSPCCRSVWIRSAAHPWWAGRAAGAASPERSWTTGARKRKRKRRGGKRKGWRRKRKQVMERIRSERKRRESRGRNVLLHK